MKKSKKKKQTQQAQPSPEQASSVQATEPAPSGASAPAELAVAMSAAGSAAAMELAPAMPETDEPRATNQTLPVLIIALSGLLFYFADMYLMEHSGQFNALVYYPRQEVPAPPGVDPEMGKRVYTSKAGCAACHQPNGAGSKAQNTPPLAGSEWVTAEGPNRLVRIVLHGLNGPIEVNGETWNNQMLPFGELLTDEDVAAVLSYVRQSWGNQASSVSPEQVTAIREAEPGRTAQWTADELQRIPVSE